MTQFVAAAGEAEGPALEAAIAAGRFAPLQLGHGAENTDGENVGPAIAKNPEDILFPFSVLQEVVDDKIRP